MPVFLSACLPVYLSTYLPVYLSTYPPVYPPFIFPHNKMTPAKPVSPLMHWWFALDIVLVTIAGIQLYILSEQTDQFFAWTIQSALTAAFLGAAYFSTIPMLWHSFRQTIWANARIALTGVWLFTTLTLILTLQHWDRFHHSSPLLTAQFAFWSWLAIYVIVPFALPISWLLQRRVPGGDPPRTRPLPAWYRAALGIQAAGMLLVGAALYLLPSAMIPLWAWTLTPLTAGAVGAWSIGIAITGAQAVWENDWRRIYGALITYALLGILQLIAVLRYSAQLDGSRPAASLYLAFIVSIFIVGALGVYLGRRAASSPAA